MYFFEFEEFSNLDVFNLNKRKINRKENEIKQKTEKQIKK
jgi:hypothetical protein